MYADVRLELPDDGPALAVPRDAVIEAADESWVFVKVDALHFQKRTVTVAGSRGDIIPVVRGLEEGEEVATGGAVFFLNAELAMKEPATRQTNQMRQ